MRRGWAWWMMAVLLASRPASALTVTDGRLGRWSVGGYAEAYGIWATDHDSQRQRPEGILDAQLTGEVHPRVRTFLDVRGLFGGPVENATGIGFVNLSDTFQNISPEVDVVEGYVDLFLPSLDVRLGKQKFAWGKLDTYQPTDVLDPRRYTDPFVTEEEDAKIGIPSMRASYFAPSFGPAFPTDMSFTLVWVPFPVATRFPLPGERWFPPAFAGQPSVDVVLDDTPLHVREHLAGGTARPAQQLDEGAVGTRLRGLYANADWALYYYRGPETLPAFDLPVTLRDLAPTANGFRVDAD